MSPLDVGDFMERIEQADKRAATLSDLLDHAFSALAWIADSPAGDLPVELRDRARSACAHIERLDPDRKAALSAR